MNAVRQKRALRGPFRAVGFSGTLAALLSCFCLVGGHDARAEAPDEHLEGPLPLKCGEVVGTRELNPLLYIWENEKWVFSHRTLVSDSHASFSWLEVDYSSSGIVIRNRQLGVGIPMTLFAIKAELLDESGAVMSEEYLHDDAECAGLSLFPGQATRQFKLHSIESSRARLLKRLRLRILASPN